MMKFKIKFKKQSKSFKLNITTRAYQKNPT